MQSDRSSDDKGSHSWFGPISRFNDAGRRPAPPPPPPPQTAATTEGSTTASTAMHISSTAPLLNGPFLAALPAAHGLLTTVGLHPSNLAAVDITQPGRFLGLLSGFPATFGLPAGRLTLPGRWVFALPDVAPTCGRPRGRPLHVRAGLSPGRRQACSAGPPECSCEYHLLSPPGSGDLRRDSSRYRPPGCQQNSPGWSGLCS